MRTAYTCAVVILLALMCASPAPAQTPTATPTPAMPSMNLEGTGFVGPLVQNGSPSCSMSSCSGAFSATVSGNFAGPVSSAGLQINFTIEFPAVPTPTATPTTGAQASIAGKMRPPTIKQQVTQLQQNVTTLQQDVVVLQEEINSLEGQSGGPPPNGCYPASETGTFDNGNFAVTFAGTFCGDGEQERLFGNVSIVQTPMSGGNEPWATGTLSAAGSTHIMFPSDPIGASGTMVVDLLGAVGSVPGLTP